MNAPFILGKTLAMPTWTARAVRLLGAAKERRLLIAMTLVAVTAVCWCAIGIDALTARQWSAARMPGAQAADAAPMRALSIANDGFVHVQGAQVVSVAGETITARSDWAAGGFSFVVHTDRSTRFILSTGEAGSEDSIAPGDSISVDGTLAGIGNGITVQAQTVRDRNAMPVQAQP